MDFRALASSSAGCCYLLSSGSLPPLLIDAGIRFELIQRALNFKLSSIAAALISHAHGDHIKAAKKLMAAGVDCYAAKETWETAKLSGHRAKVLDSDNQIQIGPWAVRAFEAVHDMPGTFGFLIADGAGHKLLYLTDSAYSKHRYQGLTHIAIECNWSEDIMRRNALDGAIGTDRYKRTASTHMSLERLINMLKANDLSTVEEIHLLHLSDANSDENEFRTRVQAATGIPTYIAAKTEAIK